MKKLDKLIADMENLTTQDDTGFSYIADEDAKDVIHYLKEYREQKYMWDAIMEFYKDIKELMRKWHEKFG